MDKKILMIDDNKEAHCMFKDKYADNFSDKYFTDEEVHVARTYKEGIEELSKGRYNTLLLDHDLGEVKTGYDILSWLEINSNLAPENIILITHNPVGAKRMGVILDNMLYKGSIKHWHWDW